MKQRKELEITGSQLQLGDYVLGKRVLIMTEITSKTKFLGGALFKRTVVYEIVSDNGEKIRISSESKLMIEREVEE